MTKIRVLVNLESDEIAKILRAFYCIISVVYEKCFIQFTCVKMIFTMQSVIHFSSWKKRRPACQKGSLVIDRDNTCILRPDQAHISICWYAYIGAGSGPLGLEQCHLSYFLASPRAGCCPYLYLLQHVIVLDKWNLDL